MKTYMIHNMDSRSTEQFHHKFFLTNRLETLCTHRWLGAISTPFFSTCSLSVPQDSHHCSLDIGLYVFSGSSVLSHCTIMKYLLCARHSSSFGVAKPLKIIPVLNELAIWCGRQTCKWITKSVLISRIYFSIREFMGMWKRGWLKGNLCVKTKI